MIRVNNLKKSYKNNNFELEVLKGINFKIEKGEFVSIMGPSGSGKSTLMNILGGLDISTSGEYFLEGTNISNFSQDQLSEIRNQKIGFVFQSFNLLEKLTAIDNVALPLIYAGVNHKKRIVRAREVLKDVGLSDRIEHLPNELSGGQRQRVAIARALVNNPPIIMADEPTGNLDSVSEEEILDIFKKLNKNGTTIIMVTHELNIARHCKRIIKFKDGVLVGDERL